MEVSVEEAYSEQMKTLLVADGDVETGHEVVAGKLEDEGYPNVTVSPEELREIEPEVSTEEYGGIVVLDGETGEAFDEETVGTVRRMAEEGAFIGAVGTGPVVLGRAGIVENRLVACDEEIEDEIRGAGATVVPELVAVDAKFVTARSDGVEEFADEFHRKLRRARVKGL